VPRFGNQQSRPMRAQYSDDEPPVIWFGVAPASAPAECKHIAMNSVRVALYIHRCVGDYTTRSFRDVLDQTLADVSVTTEQGSPRTTNKYPVAPVHACCCAAKHQQLGNHHCSRWVRTPRRSAAATTNGCSIVGA
jgi:hypothetical protein